MFLVGKTHGKATLQKGTTKIQMDANLMYRNLFGNSVRQMTAARRATGMLNFKWCGFKAKPRRAQQLMDFPH